MSRTIELDASPERVWEALTDETLLSEWLAPEVALDPRAGGEIACRDGDGGERRGRVLEVADAERLSFCWSRPGGAESRVELVLDATGDGSRLIVTETAAAPIDPSAGPRWGLRLESLRRCLASLAYA